MLWFDGKSIFNVYRCGWGIKKSGAEQVDKTMGMWIRDNGYMWYLLFPFNTKTQ